MQLHASRISPPHECQRGAFLLYFVIAMVPAIHAQQTPAQTPTEPEKTQTERKSTQPVGLFMMLERKSIVFPDIAANTARLSAEKKFELFVDNSISLHALAGASLGAGLSQAADTPRGFGQGGEAYAKRFGSSMARLASSNFFGTFVLASVLHQDPRFFPRREPTLGQGLKYSVERIFVTRNDDGRDVKNWSGLLGPLLSEGLANAYWPERDRTAAQTFQRYGVDLAVHVGTNMLREYWPLLARKMPGVRAKPVEVPGAQIFPPPQPAKAPVTR
jgi:hypothetical protein